MQSSYTICLLAPGGDFCPVIFSAHLLSYLLFCIPIAITKSYFSWKIRNEGISAMPQNQMTLWHNVIQGSRKKKNQSWNSPLCLFVCLVVPVRIKGRAIADSRFSSAMKPDSSRLLTLLGGLALFTFLLKPHVVSDTPPSFSNRTQHSGVIPLTQYLRFCHW